MVAPRAPVAVVVSKSVFAMSNPMVEAQAAEVRNRRELNSSPEECLRRHSVRATRLTLLRAERPETSVLVNFSV